MDNKRDKLIEYITEVQSIAQSALYYVKDVYDKERFLRLRDISAEMMALKTDIPVETVKGLFCEDYGYQTPKVDTREEAGKDMIFYLCEELGGAFEENSETSEIAYFAENELPDMALEKCNEEQVRMCFEAYRSNDWITQFD